MDFSIFSTKVCKKGHGLLKVIICTHYDEAKASV